MRFPYPRQSGILRRLARERRQTADIDGGVAAVELRSLSGGRSGGSVERMDGPFVPLDKVSTEGVVSICAAAA